MEQAVPTLHNPTKINYYGHSWYVYALQTTTIDDKHSLANILMSI
jgi:hypothetical protein